MRPKVIILSSVRAATSRRDFLRYGGVAAGVSFLLPSWPRLASAQSATGFDYYISPTGSDSSPGTSASPWALTAINTKQSTYAGKRVGVLPGTYSCLTLVGGAYTGQFSTPAFNIAGGSSSAQTVIQSTTPRGAILDAGANASNNPNGQPLIGCIGPLAGYITLDGFEIKNTYSRPVSVGQQTGAPFSGSRLLGIVIQNNYIHDNTNNLSGSNAAGITLYSSQGALIQNNYITNMYDNYNRSSGIEIWTSVQTITQYNTIVSAGSGQTVGIAHKNASQSNNTVRYNYIDMSKSGSGGAYATTMDDDGSGSVIDSFYNNIVIADQPVIAAAIDVGAFPSNTNQQRWYNNTFVGIPNMSVGAFVRFGASSTISFYNNIISRGTIGGRGDIDTNSSALALVDYNCYPSSPALGLSPNGSNNYPSVMSNSLSSWAAALPSSTAGKDGHSHAGDPLFVASGSGPGYYKLQAGSPCVGKGSTTGTSGGQSTDMGAWGNGASQIGANFAPGAVTSPVPDAPVLSVS
jgi:hypothetical protein